MSNQVNIILKDQEISGNPTGKKLYLVLFLDRQNIETFSELYRGDSEEEIREAVYENNLELEGLDLDDDEREEALEHFEENLDFEIKELGDFA
jgi:hypothetical protein